MLKKTKPNPPTISDPLSSSSQVDQAQCWRKSLTRHVSTLHGENSDDSDGDGDDDGDAGDDGDGGDGDGDDASDDGENSDDCDGDDDDDGDVGDDGDDGDDDLKGWIWSIPRPMNNWLNFLDR